MLGRHINENQGHTLYAAIFWGISSIFLAMSANLRMSAISDDLGMIVACRQQGY